jgi:hypothetical protein
MRESFEDEIFIFPVCKTVFWGRPAHRQRRLRSYEDIYFYTEDFLRQST